jgi:hypothetical protein
MTTLWLSFTDPKAEASDRRVLGVAIFDMGESEKRLSVADIVRRSHDLGINPGGAVSIQEVPSFISDEHKNKLITDDALLLSLGSKGRKNPH